MLRRIVNNQPFTLDSGRKSPHRTNCANAGLLNKVGGVGVVLSEYQGHNHMILQYVQCPR